MNALDRHRLLQALQVAADAIGVSDPNPRVGCVIGREDGSVLGIGSTQQAGGPHAEVMALRQAHAAGHNVQGATVWVTLEPCAHHGRTPPCCDALVAAGVARVVPAIADPFSKVAGRGIQRLRAQGIQVDEADADIAAAAREINIGFFSRHERGRPWVRVKAAASLDGRTALPNGSSRWITGIAARTDGHAWRKRAGAILTGSGTALADDPRLDVRLVPTTLQPLRVVVDSSLRLPPHARLLAPPGRVLLATTADADSPAAQALRAGGAELWRCHGAQRHVSLPALLDELARREINEVHVEAGARLNAELLRQGLVDELLVYLAPILLGPGAGIADGDVLASPQDARRFAFFDSAMVGGDLRLRVRPLDE
jgi:diaminohydroxyphosphoribosylaminopyrimidine deaminase / 5-amino-6-(5-phosphoribosylamino)uracil reductase